MRFTFAFNTLFGLQALFGLTVTVYALIAMTLAPSEMGALSVLQARCW